MTEQPKINATRFDAMMTKRRKLWGLTTIAGHLDLSVDKTRKLAERGCAPIYRPEGQSSWLAFSDELDGWMRTGKA